MKSVGLGLGEDGLNRLVGITELGEPHAEGESQKLVGSEQGAKGESLETRALHQGYKETVHKVGVHRKPLRDGVGEDVSSSKDNRGKGVGFRNVCD